MPWDSYSAGAKLQQIAAAGQMDAPPPGTSMLGWHIYLDFLLDKFNGNIAPTESFVEYAQAAGGTPESIDKWVKGLSRDNMTGLTPGEPGGPMSKAIPLDVVAEPTSNFKTVAAQELSDLASDPPATNKGPWFVPSASEAESALEPIYQDRTMRVLPPPNEKAQATAVSRLSEVLKPSWTADEFPIAEPPRAIYGEKAPAMSAAKSKFPFLLDRSSLNPGGTREFFANHSWARPGATDESFWRALDVRHDINPRLTRQLREYLTEWHPSGTDTKEALRALVTNTPDVWDMASGNIANDIPPGDRAEAQRLVYQLAQEHLARSRLPDPLTLYRGGGLGRITHDGTWISFPEMGLPTSTDFRLAHSFGQSADSRKINYFGSSAEPLDFLDRPYVGGVKQYRVPHELIQADLPSFTRSAFPTESEVFVKAKDLARTEMPYLELGASKLPVLAGVGAAGLGGLYLAKQLLGKDD